MALDARSGATPAGIAAPFVTVDHVGIARLVHAVAGLWALVAAALGALIGLERLDAGTALVDAGAHVQLVAFARVALTFGLLGGMLTSAALAAVTSPVPAARVEAAASSRAGRAWCASASSAAGPVAAVRAVAADSARPGPTTIATTPPPTSSDMPTSAPARARRWRRGGVGELSGEVKSAMAGSARHMSGPRRRVTPSAIRASRPAACPQGHLLGSLCEPCSTRSPPS